MTKIFDHCCSIKILCQKSSEQSWPELYKKCIFDHKFWAKIPWSEVCKNCVSDQIQWSEMVAIFYHYCSLKILCQIIKLHLEQSGTWIPISFHFGQITHFLIKTPKLAKGVLHVSSYLDVEPQWGPRPCPNVMKS